MDNYTSNTSNQKPSRKKQRNQKYSLPEIDRLLSLRGWTRLGDYVNASTPMELRCPQGHVTRKALAWFLGGSDCSICSGNIRLTNSEIDNRLDVGWIRVGDYINAQLPIEFVCPKGHHVELRWKSYQQGHRCRHCQYEARSGENSHLWNSELSDEDRYHSRLYPMYLQWRQNVLERDGYTCQVCAHKGGKLECHHLESYRSNRELGTNTDNGITLCASCHKEFHRLFGKKDNTTRQFLEFLDIFNGY